MEIKLKKRELKKHLLWFAFSSAAVALLLFLFFHVSAFASAQIKVDLGSGEAGDGLGVLEILFLMAILALAPSILIMMTSFTRIIIVLSFLRNAMGTQQSPSNQILIGLALFLTLFIMLPVLTEMRDDAFTPYRNQEIDEQEAIERAIVPLKRFMLKQIGPKELNLYLDLSGSAELVESMEGVETNERLMSLSMAIVVPAFITSELKRAFLIGFLLFIPFLIIDMVVSSTLMSMGMVMLPPSMIALPFKIMMFVLVDGWDLLLKTLVQGFRI